VKAQRPGVSHNDLTARGRIDPLSVNAALVGTPVSVAPASQIVAAAWRHGYRAPHMAFKLPDHLDRAKAAAEARKAKLDKFRSAPPPNEDALAARARAAEKRAEREEQRKVERAEAAVRAEEMRLAKEAEALVKVEQQRLEGIAREAAQKAARDARYAARKKGR